MAKCAPFLSARFLIISWRMMGGNGVGSFVRRAAWRMRDLPDAAAYVGNSGNGGGYGDDGTMRTERDRTRDECLRVLYVFDRGAVRGVPIAIRWTERGAGR